MKLTLNPKPQTLLVETVRFSRLERHSPLPVLNISRLQLLTEGVAETVVGQVVAQILLRSDQDVISK